MGNEDIKENNVGEGDGREDFNNDNKEGGNKDDNLNNDPIKYSNNNPSNINNPNININNFTDFENQFVHNFYDYNSKEFNITRQRLWPKTKEFLDIFYKGGIVLDNGCGNGRCIINKNIIGLDYSLNLLKEAKIKKDNVLLRGDGLELPFLNNSFDLILSIAVIHHFSTKERRIKALEEIKRVLKPKGKCLIYVWDEETKYKNKFKPIKNKESEDGNDNINSKDYFVLWNNQIKRYYYLFDLKELKTFCEELDFKIIEIGKEQESLYVIIEKKEMM